MKKHEKRFKSLRARWLSAGQAMQEFRAKMDCHYGNWWYSHHFTAAQQKKQLSLRRRSEKVSDAFYELLDTISPRQWRSGVSYHWVLNQLTYADATTTGALSVMPQAAYGATESQMRELMRPVRADQTT